MLQGINPLLTGELLAHLDRLGHGDTVVIADANFPAHRIGAAVVEVPGASAPTVLAAIRSVLPLDGYAEAELGLMSSAGDTAAGVPAGELLAVQQELVTASGASTARVEMIERFAFYTRAESAQLIVRTGELRPYGNAILPKGVVTAQRDAAATVN